MSRISLLVLCIALVCASAAAEWVNVPGGPGTACAHGTPYSYFYKPGTTNKLAIFFEGGGACWDAGSCLLPIYSQSVSVNSELSRLNSADGILSATDPRSPTAGHHILYIPYCTGDVHTGNHTADYGSYKIEHKGRVNVADALSFIQGKVPDPESVVQIGCSAGSLGVFVNSAFVMARYPNAKHAVWGDSEVGIVSPAQWAGAWDNWHFTLAPFIPSLNEKYTRNYTETIVGQILVDMANYFPQHRYSAYSSDYDLVQTSFYKMGGGKEKWTDLMRAQFDYIHKNADVGSFIAGGGAHCRSTGSEFYSVKVGDTFLYKWVSDVFAGNTFNRTVDCGTNCLFAEKDGAAKEYSHDVLMASMTQ